MDDKTKKALKESKKLQSLDEPFPTEKDLKEENKEFQKEASKIKKLLTPKLWFLNTEHKKKGRGKRSVE